MSGKQRSEDPAGDYGVELRLRDGGLAASNVEGVGVDDCVLGRDQALADETRVLDP